MEQIAYENSKLILGVQAVRFSTLEAICKALECQPADILEYLEGAEN